MADPKPKAYVHRIKRRVANAPSPVLFFAELEGPTDPPHGGAFVFNAYQLEALEQSLRELGFEPVRVYDVVDSVVAMGDGPEDIDDSPDVYGGFAADDMPQDISGGEPGDEFK